MSEPTTSSSSTPTPLPTLDSITDATIRERLRELASNARIIKDTITLMEDDYKDAMDKVTKFVKLHRLQSVRGDDTNGDPFTIYRKPNTRSTIVPQKLIEHGVPVSVIEECTEVKSWETVEIHRPKNWLKERKENENV